MARVRTQVGSTGGPRKLQQLHGFTHTRPWYLTFPCSFLNVGYRGAYM